MNVRELLEMLEGVDPENEVMIAEQPGWPLAARLEGVVDAADLPHSDEDDCGLPATDPRAREDILWLAAGDASEYAPGAVFEAV